MAGHGEGQGGAELTEGPRGPGAWGWRWFSRCSLRPAFLQPRLPTGPPVTPAEPVVLAVQAPRPLPCLSSSSWFTTSGSESYPDSDHVSQS